MVGNIDICVEQRCTCFKMQWLGTKGDIAGSMGDIDKVTVNDVPQHPRITFGVDCFCRPFVIFRIWTPTYGDMVVTAFQRCTVTSRMWAISMCIISPSCSFSVVSNLGVHALQNFTRLCKGEVVHLTNGSLCSLLSGSALHTPAAILRSDVPSTKHIFPPVY